VSPPKAGEPLLLIRLFNGSEIVAEKIWAQGDRVIYERAGFRGSVRATDVLALIDRDLEVKLAVCSVKFREVEAKVREMQQTARDLRQEGFTIEERQAIAGAQDRIIHLEAGQARRLCDQALAKWSQNMRMLQEAQRRSNSKR
jgi:hypothetical protein